MILNETVQLSVDTGINTCQIKETKAKTKPDEDITPAATHACVTADTMEINNLYYDASAENFHCLMAGTITHMANLLLLLLTFLSKIIQSHFLLSIPHVLIPPAQLTFDHANVVSAVSYGQGDGLLVLLDELHHLGFLQRGDSAADHRFARARCRHKLRLHVCFKRMGLSENRGRV